MVLDSCNFWLNQSSNKIESLSADCRQEMLEAITKMAEESLRTLCIAYKPIRK